MEDEETKLINLNSLSKSELITLLLNQININQRNFNKIEISDFAVWSYESLEICEATIDRLIDKHKDFITARTIKSNDNTIGIG